MEFTEVLIKSIIDNKDMPKVQVEREISPILEIFIEDILSSASKFKNKIDEGKYKFIAPEFPLQSKKLENNKETNRSTNIDYLLFNETTKELYFVELKTDSSSFKYEQFEIYDELINNDGFKVSNLYEFLANNLTNKKYINLKELLLQNMGFDKNSNENPFKDVKGIKLVYIAPERMLNRDWKNNNLEAIKKIKEKYTCITFSELSRVNTSNYSKEWKIIKNYIRQLDEN